MFTAERMAQILLAIVMMATALVIMIKKPSQQSLTAEAPIADTIRNVVEDTTACIATSKKTTPKQKKEGRKTAKKTKAPVKQRDHLQEPMKVTENE